MEGHRRGEWRTDGDRDYWRSDEEYIASVEEDPLVWMKRPVECSYFEVVQTPAPALRIAYSTAGTASGPNHSLGDVVSVKAASSITRGSFRSPCSNASSPARSRVGI